MHIDGPEEIPNQSGLECQSYSGCHGRSRDPPGTEGHRGQTPMPLNRGTRGLTPMPLQRLPAEHTLVSVVFEQQLARWRQTRGQISGNQRAKVIAAADAVDAFYRSRMLHDFRVLSLQVVKNAHSALFDLFHSGRMVAHGFNAVV